MSQEPNSDPRGEHAPHEPSRERRRALKAAAAAAPLIATLPSGAALAMASTRQCMISSRNQSQNTYADLGSDFTVKGGTDKFLRVPTNGYTYTKRNSSDVSEKWFQWGEFWYRQEDEGRNAWSKVGADPDKYERAGVENVMYPPGQWTREESVFWLIVLVEPENSDTGDPAHPSDFGAVSLWPLAEPGSSDDGLIGIAHSCACSITPGLTVNNIPMC
jgi:hypothetical protein